MSEGCTFPSLARQARIWSLAYPNISAAFGRGNIRDSVDFSARLLQKAHVAVTPGEAFGTTDHVRISYATSMEQLDKGIGRIREFMEFL